MAEHFLPSYSRLLDRFIDITLERQSGHPLEAVDRVDAIYGALSKQGWERNQLLALLAIAVDRLTVQKVGGPQ